MREGREGEALRDAEKGAGHQRQVCGRTCVCRAARCVCVCVCVRARARARAGCLTSVGGE